MGGRIHYTAPRPAAVRERDTTLAAQPKVCDEELQCTHTCKVKAVIVTDAESCLPQAGRPRHEELLLKFRYNEALDAALLTQRHEVRGRSWARHVVLAGRKAGSIPTVGGAVPCSGRCRW